MFQKFFKGKQRRGNDNKGTRGTRLPYKSRKRERSNHRDDDREQTKKQNTTIANHTAAETVISSSNHAQTEQPKKQSKRHGRGPPSAAALELSSQLKQLSMEKKWKQALDIYQDLSNNAIRDSHHACIMVDMAARCGRIMEGERIYKDIEGRNAKISIELKTALIKGYAHSGMSRKADSIFHDMCSSKSKAGHPNVRTLNTLLRGCLWSAATADEHDCDDKIVGGIVSAERAWQAYSWLHDASDKNAVFDVSSYEYFISLLCQALRVEDAKARIEDMKMTFGLLSYDNASTVSDDQSVTEALAAVYLALGRAYASLGEAAEAKAACRKSLSFAMSSRSALKSDNLFSRKRAWKNNEGEANRRAESNSIYRNHRLTEMCSEAETVIEICQNSGSMKDGTPRDIARRLATRLVYLSGGGTTTTEHENDKSADHSLSNSKTIQKHLMNSLYFSFGLSRIVSQLGIPISTGQFKALTQKETNRILGSVGLQGGVVNDDGTLDLHRIFSAGIGTSQPQKIRKKRKSQRIEVELGAGFGDWIVRKAIENPATLYMAVELRADRVAQIFARTSILSYSAPINNLCVVGSDSEGFLSKSLKPESIDKIYVNHPEPPTQTFGAESYTLNLIMQGGEEPAHMLHSNVLVAAGKALKKGSKLVIVTDNKWYGRLICATLSKIKGTLPGLLENHNLVQEDGSYQATDFQDLEGIDEAVPLFEGQPNETIGYPSRKNERGESYFDRLWRVGGSTHAESRSRYIIVQKRGNGNGV